MNNRRRNRQGGFIIIFGWRTITTSDGSPHVDMVCPECSEESRMRGRVRRQWFTLFFLPVFPLEPKTDEMRFCECMRCKATFDRTTEQMARNAAAYSGNDHASAIALYNRLRDNPTDSVTLAKLIRMYAEMDEIGEAEAACRHFPQAYKNDPTCAIALREAQAQTV